MFDEQNYENILRATFQISNINIKQSKEDFKSNILQVLNDYLHYHHILFWEVEDSELNETPTVLNINKFTIKDYLATYKYYDPLHPSNMKNQPTIQVIQSHDEISIQEKKYYKDYFLKQNEFTDEMVMYLKEEERPVAVIGLLRKREEQQFNKQDIMKLCYLQKLLENMYLLNEYKQLRNLYQFTLREEELLGYVCRGYKNHEIAKLLFVSENTVKKHLQNLYQKCKVTNRTQLALIYSQENKI